MNESAPLFEKLRTVFLPTERGVVGLADDLMKSCGDRGIQFQWHADKCRVRELDAPQAEWTEMPVSKSVFRALLARIAALCNEHIPHSVTPYGGQGEWLAANTQTLFRVSFTNTPTEQRLEIRPTIAATSGNEAELRAPALGRIQPMNA